MIPWESSIMMPSCTPFMMRSENSFCPLSSSNNFRFLMAAPIKSLKAEQDGSSSSVNWSEKTISTRPCSVMGIDAATPVNNSSSGNGTPSTEASTSPASAKTIPSRFRGSSLMLTSFSVRGGPLTTFSSIKAGSSNLTIFATPFSPHSRTMF